MEFTEEINAISPNPSYVKNAQGRIVSANKAFADLHGLPLACLLEKGKLDPDYSHEKDLELIKNTGTLSYDEFFNLKNGRKAWYHTIKKTFLGADGLVYIFSTSLEITRLKTALLEANASANYEEVILTNLVHELRSSINGITDTTQQLLGGAQDQHQLWHLKTITHHSENLLFLVNNFLDFYKTLAYKVKLDLVPFRVENIVRDTIRSLIPEAEELRTPLRYLEPLRTLPVLEGDPLRLTQVIIYFIRFALEFARGGQIILSVTEKETSGNKLELEFSVEHFGTAINLEKFKKVAQSFGQTLKRSYSLDGNLNFKLKLCKDLIALQGGTTWLKRNGAFGYTFHFKIPFPLSAVQPQVEENTAGPKPQSLQGLRILLAEDNEINQLIATSYLDSWGVRVDSVYNGEEALALAREELFDLILMDIQMPKINGFEVTHRLKTEPNPNQHTPILAFTANVLKNDVEQFKDYGFKDYLIKPYQKDHLYQLLVKNMAKGVNINSHGQLEAQEQAPAREPEPPLYDFSDLGHLAHDAVFIRKMQQLFQKRAPEQLALLVNAYQEKDRETMAQIAHNLKSTYGNIKIMPAAEALKKIEDIARSDKALAEVPALLDIVHQITDKVLAKLEAEGQP
jgi:two-component system, OmpR family, aerobic respiration control sensor histidine kinase ArcB